MAKLVYALNQSLDGFIDHDRFAPDDVLFQHFIEDIGSLAGCIYGRKMYELMRYWDEEHPEWDAPRREYAVAWRRQPKWVVSRTMTEVGPNATLVSDDVEKTVRELKSRFDGVIEVAASELAAGLAGLIDEYHNYLHPVVLGRGKPFFVGEAPRLRLLDSERIGADVVRLRYAPI